MAEPLSKAERRCYLLIYNIILLFYHSRSELQRILPLSHVRNSCESIQELSCDDKVVLIFLKSHNFQTGSMAHPVSYSVGTGVYSSGGKVAGA
jgi:hypothetical protein